MSPNIGRMKSTIFSSTDLSVFRPPWVMARHNHNGAHYGETEICVVIEKLI
jgi:hypothetical protein